MTSYRVLTGVTGILLILGGFGFTLAFFGFWQPGAEPSIPTGPVGYYFVAFSGCALIGWGGGLLNAARHPEAGRLVGTFTALVLCIMAFVRIGAWVMGDYYTWLGDLLRYEAAVLLLLALAFVWLRPSESASPLVPFAPSDESAPLAEGGS